MILKIRTPFQIDDPLINSPYPKPKFIWNLKLVIFITTYILLDEESKESDY